LAVVSSPVTFGDFEALRYSSRLLLSVSLPNGITNDVEYAQGCADGFDFFSEYSQDCESLAALRACILQELFPGPSDDASLALRIGCVHGFLSFLAFIDRGLALAGLDFLVHLVDHLAFLSAASSEREM